MYIKEFDIVLDIKNSTKRKPFEVVQGDSQSNLLNISMTNGLEPYDLTGTTTEIVFYKSDSTTVQQTQESGVVVLNAPEGKIQCTLKTNTIACPGKVIAEIRISSDEILLTSGRFEFYVRKSLINDKTVESTDEFPVLTQLMQDTSTLIDQVNQIEKQVPENVVSRIDAMESGKVDKTDIVQTDTISDASKVPSSVVTNKLSSQVTELNKNLQIMPIPNAEQYLETAYTIRYFNMYQYGNIISLRLVINNQEGVFPQGRVELGTLKKYAPMDGILIPISASVNVNSFLTRMANLVISSRTLSVDNHANNDVREFTIQIMYLTNDI